MVGHKRGSDRAKRNPWVARVWPILIFVKMISSVYGNNLGTRSPLLNERTIGSELIGKVVLVLMLVYLCFPGFCESRYYDYYGDLGLLPTKC